MAYSYLHTNGKMEPNPGTDIDATQAIEIAKELQRKNKLSFDNFETRRRSMLGAVGERLARWKFKITGFEVDESLDPMDKEKDFMIKMVNGTKWLKVEVKTQTPWYKKEAFTIRVDQRAKMQGCDILVFIETPRIKDKRYNWDFLSWKSCKYSAVDLYESPIYIYDAVKNGPLSFLTKTTEFFAKENREMILIPMRDLTRIGQFDRPEHVQLLDKFSNNSMRLKI